MTLRLGVLASHPIQYQAPLFRQLARRVDLHVLFAHKQTPAQQAAAGYGVPFEWDVDLLTGFPHTFLRNRSRNPGVGHFFGCDTPEVAEWIRDARLDVFLVMGWNLLSYWQAVRACRRHGVPVMVRGDSQLQTPRSRFKRATKRITHALALRQFDALLAVGARSREYFLHYGAAPAEVFFAPHCVDVAWFRERAGNAIATRSATRAALGARPNDLVVLFVGRLLGWKRPGDVLLACRRLLDDGLRAVPVFVGSGPMAAALRASADALGVPAHFAGFRNQGELPSLYVAADMLALPSTGNETWGLVVNEAMACGCPAVVSSTVGCALDLVEHGMTGAVYAVGDVSAMATAIREAASLRSTPELPLALAARMRVFSPEAAAAGVEAAARAVAAGTSSRSPSTDR